MSQTLDGLYVSSCIDDLWHEMPASSIYEHGFRFLEVQTETDLMNYQYNQDCDSLTGDAAENLVLCLMA